MDSLRKIWFKRCFFHINVANSCPCLDPLTRSSNAVRDRVWRNQWVLVTVKLTDLQCFPMQEKQTNSCGLFQSNVWLAQMNTAWKKWIQSTFICLSFVNTLMGKWQFHHLCCFISNRKKRIMGWNKVCTAPLFNVVSVSESEFTAGSL